jgi:transposase
MIPQGVEVYVAAQPMDMRKGIERLGGLVREHFGREPRSKAIFVFINRRKTALKVLSWDGTGMVLWYKKLDSGLFEQPAPERSGDYSVQISEVAFEALFAGLETQGRLLH